jgi:hypothetical protein
VEALFVQKGHFLRFCIPFFNKGLENDFLRRGKLPLSGAGGFTEQ